MRLGGRPYFGVAEQQKFSKELKLRLDLDQKALHAPRDRSNSGNYNFPNNNGSDDFFGNHTRAFGNQEFTPAPLPQAPIVDMFKEVKLPESFILNAPKIPARYMPPAPGTLQSHSQPNNSTSAAKPMGMGRI